MTEPAPAAAPHRGLKRKTKLILLGIFLTPIALFALYIWAALTWNYSEGERAGILQKFSQKGWICKTYEGEIAMTSSPGVMPIIWDFSARDDQVAEQLRAAIGTHVALHYTEHRGLPGNCFGDTRYFVDRVTVR
jgi:hypothetical protein